MFHSNTRPAASVTCRLITWMTFACTLLISSCAAPDNSLRAGDPIPSSRFDAIKIVGDGFDAPPRLLSGNAPIYPISQVLGRKSGSAQLAYTIDESGLPKDIRVVYATYKYFGSHSVIALRKWKFSPALLHGQPVAVQVTQTFFFEVH